MWNIFGRKCSNLIGQNLVAAYFKGRAIFSGKFHSTESSVSLNKMKIVVLPALTDNYMYLIIDEATNQAAIVDPVTPETVLDAVKREDCVLTKILTTHHHWDHAGGNDAMVKKCSQELQVYGGDDRIASVTTKVQHGDRLSIGNILVECLFTPCHTSGHICYYVPAAEDYAPAVFTGDTLFIGGCGRFFEGTPHQMYTALLEILGQLPDETRVFCGHEYTEQNLRFAQRVEPHNSDVQDKIQWTQLQRARNQPTVPSSIGEEKRFNPFMRVKEYSVQEYANCSEPINVMGAIRQAKDNFK